MADNKTPTKLTIHPLDGRLKDKMVIADFNPKEYAVSKTVPWNPQAAGNFDAPEMQFTAGQGEQLKFDLFFDTYEKGTNVRDKTGKLRELTLIDSETHRPPLLKVTWGGGFSLQCVMESLNIRYTMFTSDGTPVRATCSVGFKEARGFAEQEKTNPRASPDHAKIRAILRGDTLQSIAFEEYDDAAEWRRIADANGIDDPSILEPGLRLLIPPILN